MPRVQWDVNGSRVFETGVDRGMLYVLTTAGVPWNGLMKVTENPVGGKTSEYFTDGRKRLATANYEEYSAVIQAISSPPEFISCVGFLEIAPGLFADSQPCRPFGFSYRTLIGDDVRGTNAGYKIHIVYNALAKVSDFSHETIGDSFRFNPYSWTVTTRPEKVRNARPASHFVVDSRKVDAGAVKMIEDILYGTEVYEPRLISVDELDMIMSGVQFIYGIISGKKSAVYGTGEGIAVVYPGITEKKIQLSGTGAGQSVITSAVKLKKAGISASLTGRSVASGAVAVKKMKPQGSDASLVTVSVSLKKESVSGSGTKVSVASGSISGKKMGVSGVGLGHLRSPFKIGSGNGVSGATARPFAVSSPTQNGDTIEVACISNSGTNYPTGITDSKGNVYTQIRQLLSSPSYTIFRSPGATGGASGGKTAALTVSDTITVTMNSTTNAVASIAIGLPSELSGADDVLPASISELSGATITATATPAKDGDIALALFGNTVNGGQPSINAPYISLGVQQAGGSPWVSAGYRLLGAGTSGVAQSATATITSAINSRAILHLISKAISEISDASGGISGKKMQVQGNVVATTLREDLGFTLPAAADEFGYAVTTWGDASLAAKLSAWDAKAYGNNAGWSNVSLDGDHLLLRCSYDSATGTISQAFLEGTRLGHFAPPYYVEARAKCPAVYGFWPSPVWTWSYPYGSTPGVEVDMGEFLGRTPSQLPQTVQGVTSGLTKTWNFPEGQDISGWHIYSAAVYTDRVDFYVDGALTNTITTAEMTSFGGVDRMSQADLCVDIFAGGAWAGTPSGSSTQVMTVDYVRAWTPVPLSPPYVVSSKYMPSLGPVTRDSLVTKGTEAGDTILAFAFSNTTLLWATNVTDSKGNVYTLDKSSVTFPLMAVFRSPGATGGPGGGPTVALTTSDKLTYTTNEALYNLYGIAVGLPSSLAGDADVIPGSVTSGTDSSPVVSVTPSADNEIFVSFFVSGSPGGLPVLNSPFTLLDTKQIPSGTYGTAGYHILGEGTAGNAQISSETIIATMWKAYGYAFRRASQ